MARIRKFERVAFHESPLELIPSLSGRKGLLNKR